jgi:hypothetical protein
MKRIMEDDRWLDNFLFFHDYNIKNAFVQCWETLVWRKKIGVNGRRKY